MTSIEQSPPPAHEPARVLGTLSAGCVVVGAIIGVGIFFNPSQVADRTGSATLALTAWAVAGGIALCGALTFAALGRRYHASGAQYEILRDSFGPLPGFLFVFCNATAVQAGAIGIIAMICAQYVGTAATGTAPEGPALTGLALALIVGVTVANIVGVRWGATIQNFTVFAKVATLLAVTALAAFAAPDAPPRPEVAADQPAGVWGSTRLVMAALVPAFFAYGGWQHALWISGEVRDPERTLPRAITGGVLLVVVVYLLANWAYLELLGLERVRSSGALAADAVEVVFPRFGGRVIAGAVALSAFGVLNAQLLSGPRLVFGMARDGRFFGVFGRTSRRFGTPVGAIVLLSGMALAIMVLDALVERVVGGENNPVDRMLTGVVFIDSIFFGMTGVAALVLFRRLRGGAARSALRAWGLIAVIVLFVVGELALVAGSFMSPVTRGAAALGLIWIGLATVLYLVRFRRAPGGYSQ